MIEEAKLPEYPRCGNLICKHNGRVIGLTRYRHGHIVQKPGGFTSADSGERDRWPLGHRNTKRLADLGVKDAMVGAGV